MSHCFYAALFCSASNSHLICCSFAGGEDWLNFDVLRSLVGVGDTPSESPKAGTETNEPIGKPVEQEAQQSQPSVDAATPNEQLLEDTRQHDLPASNLASQGALQAVNFGQEASISIEGISAAGDYDPSGAAALGATFEEQEPSQKESISSEKETNITDPLVSANREYASAPTEPLPVSSVGLEAAAGASGVSNSTAAAAATPQLPLESQQQQRQGETEVTVLSSAPRSPGKSQNGYSNPENNIDTETTPEVASSAEVIDTSALDELALKKMNIKDLRALVSSLQETLHAREAQLERQAQEAATAAMTVASLAQKNEELVLARAAVSEKDVEDMRMEFETRLAAAERKAAALAKERDELRRSSKTNNMEGLLRQKDEEIRQIMEEGEILSKKQLSQETTIKQLRGKVKELKDEATSLNTRLESEQQRATIVVKEKEALSAELAALQERNVELLAAERQHFERRLGEARTATVVAEKKAEEAVKAGAARKLRDAEARIEALEATVEQLRDELERKRAAADEREDMLASEVAELQRLCSESEARQQELQTKLPEATAALLQQLEAMQVAADAASATAAATERSLQQQIAAAEATAVEAREAAAAASAAIADAEGRAAAAEEMLKASKEALRSAEAVTSEEKKARLAAEGIVSRLRSDVASAQDSLATLEKVYAQQMKALQAKEAEAARAAAALREELRSRQAATAAAASAQASPAAQKDANPQPPALAAPGFKWVMVKEGEEALSTFAPTAAGVVNTPRKYLETPGATAGDQSAVDFTLPTPAGTRENAFVSEAGLPHWASPAGGLIPALSAAHRGTKGADPAALAALQRTVQDLEATRDRLSEELVRAEGEAAAGRTAAARVAELEVEVATLRQRYAHAVEILGEREEKIEELAADVVEMRDSYRQQVVLLADEIERLQQRVSELEAVQ